MNLVLLSDREITSDSRALLTGDRARHLIHVLGCSPGRTVRVGIADGGTGEGLVTAVGEDSVEMQFRIDGPTPTRPRIDLLLALPRPKVLGRILEHVTALGVGRIVLVRSWHVEKSYFQSALLEESGYRPRLVAGLEQACDTRVPEIHVFRAFKPFVEDHLDAVLGPGQRLLAHHHAAATLAASPIAGEGRIAWAVGPERGWTDYEVDRLTEKGFTAVRLGRRVLRVETAVTAGMAQIQALGRCP